MTSAGDSTGDVTPAEKVAFLARPESYPRPTGAVRTIETHMSWVFVTDDLVYKMKKPVHFSYLDFSTLELRRHFCKESVRLNRRLAGDVYLGVVALTLEPDGRLCLEGAGRPVEWLEKMRRLPAEQMLDVALAADRVSEAEVRRFGAVLARFYRTAAPVPMSTARYRTRFVDGIEANRAALSDARYRLDPESLARVATRQLQLVRDHGAALDGRVTGGHVIEAHGDLRPEHVCLLPEPVFIDCLEFNRAFRLLDAADELGYLAMECEFIGAGFVGPALFATYEQESGDRVPPRVVHFYKSYRALLRAKLAAWHVQDHPAETHGKWLGMAARYLTLADRHAAALPTSTISRREPR